jgi:hypothetical protein
MGFAYRPNDFEDLIRALRRMDSPDYDGRSRPAVKKSPNNTHREGSKDPRNLKGFPPTEP